MGSSAFPHQFFSFSSSKTAGTAFLVFRSKISPKLYKIKGRLLAYSISIVKSGASVMPGEVVSWSASIPELVAKEEQEDEEPGIEETAGRKTEQAGTEEPRRRPEDRWPRGAYS
ncbi:hypothetical protein NDU88_002412 [Pleurodeles waltl]|uniref:Uncharacterized protein n=1 Tax=Pleurodeles waltl TaxID=8319 RepID=A0AAV7P6V4_PLEWA|nr:hypothetical protein NDU88_002412 [Pleurodeles waltl]